MAQCHTMIKSPLIQRWVNISAKYCWKQECFYGEITQFIPKLSSDSLLICFAGEESHTDVHASLSDSSKVAPIFFFLFLLAILQTAWHCVELCTGIFIRLRALGDCLKSETFRVKSWYKAFGCMISPWHQRNLWRSYHLSETMASFGAFVSFLTGVCILGKFHVSYCTFN